MSKCYKYKNKEIHNICKIQYNLQHCLWGRNWHVLNDYYVLNTVLGSEPLSMSPCFVFIITCQSKYNHLFFFFRWGNLNSENRVINFRNFWHQCSFSCYWGYYLKRKVFRMKETMWRTKTKWSLSKDQNNPLHSNPCQPRDAKSHFILLTVPACLSVSKQMILTLP